MDQVGLAITISRRGALRVLLEVSMELRLISRSSVFSGSAWVIIFYIPFFLNRAVWYGFVLYVCAGRETVGRSWPWDGSGHLQNSDYEDFEGFSRSLSFKLYVWNWLCVVEVKRGSDAGGSELSAGWYVPLWWIFKSFCLLSSFASSIWKDVLRVSLCRSSCCCNKMLWFIANSWCSHFNVLGFFSNSLHCVVEMLK